MEKNLFTAMTHENLLDYCRESGSDFVDYILKELGFWSLAEAFASEDEDDFLAFVESGCNGYGF